MTDRIRTRKLNGITYSKGDIVYWMSRDQRVNDNWALLFAQELAEKHNANLSVIFCLRQEFDFATERLVDFMFGGLKEVEEKLSDKNIPFHFLLGNPEEEIPKFVSQNKVGTLISDFFPLKYNKNWKNDISSKTKIPFFEVDTHNIVPAWEASQKQEFGAYTIRPKIHKLLPEFLTEFPEIKRQRDKVRENNINWEKIRTKIKFDKTVKKVDWLTPGENASEKALQKFINFNLKIYSQDRNDPTKDGQSNLSPYIHFGHIAAQRIALEVSKVKGDTKSKEEFLEELIVRRELSDNYCYYNKDYDNPEGFSDWAKETLDRHADDRREHIYSLKQLESASTHDMLWNAAQNEMLKRGKMHGYMRMYWAKKIFEWSENAAVAQKNAIHLNDKYFLDGRDPNGYTGIAWSIGGVHDRAWPARPIFGKVRYMNANGAARKFDTEKYIKRFS